MKRKNPFLPILAALAVALCLPATGRAQADEAQDPSWGLNLSLATVNQWETDVADSRFDLSRSLVGVEKNLVRNRKLILGLGASFGLSDYTFSGPPADPWSDPWGTVRNADVGVSVLLPGSGGWSYFLMGALEWSMEEDADATDNLVTGVVASAAYHFRSDRLLGLGGGVFSGLEERKVFPYLTVSWSLGENLTLQNPLRAGPAGPAGLELVYDPSGRWQFGGGAAYRSFRFRLDDEGIAPGGVGEVAGFPFWLRASWQPNGKVDLGIYAGAVLAGEAIIEDRSGRGLESRHLDPAPLAALTLQWSL